MLRRLLVVLSITSVFMTLSLGPAHADSWDSLPEFDLDGAGGCSPSESISVLVVAVDVYKMRAQGDVDCPGTGVTILVVCVLQQLPTGYEPVACDAGASPNTASASAETVCVPGARYKAGMYLLHGDAGDKFKTGYVTCPDPL